MKNEQLECSCSESQQTYPEFIHDGSSSTTYLRGQFLGMGSFGRCFVMKELQSGKTYAAKILEKNLLKHPFHSCCILEELAIHRLLRHKNIVSFFQTFDDENFIYIILELCSNGSLMDLQKRRQCVTLLEAKYYLYHIINGVNYLHKKHIVHGDLKLSNIFLNYRMAVKIGDFGLATALSNEGDEIKIQCGTPNYMAPEIVQKKGHSYAGDVWAIGCILYGLLVGKLPFQSQENYTTYHKIKNCDFSVYEPGLRKQVSMFIRKILQKEPETRPSIIELKSDEFMQGFIPVSLPEYTLWKPPLPKDLITRTVRFAKSSVFSSKIRTNNSANRNTILNRKKRMKPSVSRIKYTNTRLFVGA